MHRYNRWFTRRRAFGVGIAAALVALVGLQGCHRGGWHGRGDPARFEERMNDVQAEIADELELQPAQRPEFDGLMERYKELARQWRTGWRDTAQTVYGAVETQPADARAVGEALKQRFRERPDPAVIDRLIDDTVAFYETLTPEQQEVAREHVAKRLRWHLPPG